MEIKDFSVHSPGQLERIPEGVEAFVPDPLPPPPTAFALGACVGLADESLLALGGLKQAISSSPATTLVVDSFLRREAVRSSEIEGTHTQLGQLLLFEVGETESQFTDVVDAEQVERNLSAIKAGLNLIDQYPLCGRVFREVHSVLFDGANKLTKMPGEYRNASTRIGGQSFTDARFVPPPHGYIQQAMNDLEQFINLPQKHGHLPVVVQMALMHYQFETIHPFCDGNGRIGRLAISLLLKSRGYLPQPILCLSAYMDEHRNEYTNLMLAVSQKGKWNDWIEFFLNGVRVQAEDDTRRCGRLMELRDHYLKICDSNKIPLAVVDSLFRFPITSIPAAAKLEDKSFPTGKRWVEALEEADVLIEVTKRDTNKVYLAQQIIDTLEGPLE